MKNNELQISISRKVFNSGFLPYLNNDKRYLVFYGGAGSGKSFFICERFIYKMLKAKRFNLLVVRKTGKSNRDSTFALFKQVISKWKLSKYFKINESDLRIKCLLNNHEIVFAGLDDVEKLKSITFSDGELTDVWIEEASEILESDFNQLDVRLRGKGTKKQIVISFNPIDINHWLKKRFFDRKDDNIEIFHSTYKDNEFLDDDYKKLLESYKETDEYYYNVYCLGQWGVLGKTVFDARAVNRRMQEIPKPLKVGYFIYDYDGLEITNIRFVNDRNGFIKIYEMPNSPEVTKYCIGGDTAGGEGTSYSDFFTAHVINAKNGKQAAVLRHQFDADQYAKQIYCLGKWFGTGNSCEEDALIGIESNFDSFPIRELTRLGYTNQFVRNEEDTYTGKLQKRFGFRTDRNSRPRIISNLVEIVREHTYQLNDRETLEEMLTFVRNEKGRPEAQEGAHDDLVMGLAIAYEIQDQVTFNEEPIITEHRFTFNVETPVSYDYGDSVSII